MEDKIICNINIFDESQKIFVYKNDISEIVGSTTLSTAANDLLKIGEEQGISKYHILCLTDYADKIVEDLQVLNILNYGENHIIEIEVN